MTKAIKNEEETLIYSNYVIIKQESDSNELVNIIFKCVKKIWKFK